MKIARTLKTGLLIFLTTTAYNASAEVFTLENVKKAQSDPNFPPALIKNYKANRSIDVKYSYSYDEINDQKRLLLTFSTKDTAIQDLLDYGIVVDNVDSPIIKNSSVHDKFHRILVLSGFFFLKIASTFLNSSFFPKPIKRRIAI